MYITIIVFCFCLFFFLCVCKRRRGPRFLFKILSSIQIPHLFCGRREKPHNKRKTTDYFAERCKTAGLPVSLHLHHITFIVTGQCLTRGMLRQSLHIPIVQNVEEHGYLLQYWEECGSQLITALFLQLERICALVIQVSLHYK